MWSRLKNGWYLLTGNLWFKPLGFSILIFALMAAISVVDYNFKIHDTPLGVLYNAELSVAQDIAVALMTSMMTMTTLVISITMVVLSLATSQMGPRLIQTFVSDRKTQSYIGLFFGAVVATFYCVRVTHSQYFTDDLLPVLTITATVIYCFASLFILLFFIHHVATACMADTIINKVGEDLFDDIERVYKSPSHLGGFSTSPPLKPEKPKGFTTEVFVLRAGKEGYVQSVSSSTLLAKAKENDLFITLPVLAGAHVFEGQVLAHVFRERDIRSHDEKDALQKKLEDAFVIGNRRTRSQDVGYSLRHLIEVALRALSPGINDPFTAFKVLDKLGQGLICLDQKQTGKLMLEDGDGTKRLCAYSVSLDEFVSLAFAQIREAASSRLDVNLHMLGVIKRISADERVSDRLRKVLVTHVKAIEEIVSRLATQEQKKQLQDHIAEVLKSLK